MRFGPRSLFCQDPKAILDALKLERDLLDKVNGVASHQLQRLKLEEFALEHLIEKLEQEDDPLEALRPDADAASRPLTTVLLEEDVATVRESVSTVQEGVTGTFPDAARRMESRERPEEDAADVESQPRAKRLKSVDKHPVLERLIGRANDDMSAEPTGGDANADRPPPLHSGSRYDALKRAAIDHYQTGISLKNAANKHGVGVRELKEFYENEAADFISKKNFASSDESEEDP